jgi:hypothetical protein
MIWHANDQIDLFRFLARLRNRLTPLFHSV